MNRIRIFTIAATIGILLAANPIIQASPRVGTDSYAVYFPMVRRDRQGLSVDTSSRESVQAFYFDKYVSVESANALIDWTGNVAGCDPGTTSSVFKAAALQRINWFRAMAGVPADIVLSDEYNQKAQAAALIMAANRALSHYPPPDWLCYSDIGADGASHSNIQYGWGGSGGLLQATARYIQDAGDNNASVGHRRWILYPATMTMGTGDVPGSGNPGDPYANAMWVVDSNYWNPRPPTRHTFVAWPPPGFVPYQVVYARWSFSLPQADFTAASVTMLLDGEIVAVTLEPVHNGTGDNTLVWIPYGMYHGQGWPNPGSDRTYSVTISNVVISGMPQQINYSVTVFDP